MKRWFKVLLVVWLSFAILWLLFAMGWSGQGAIATFLMFFQPPPPDLTWADTFLMAAPFYWPLLLLPFGVERRKRRSGSD